MKDFEQWLSGGLSRYPALNRIFDKEKLQTAYQQGVESGLKAEDNPALRQIETEVVLSRDPLGLSPQLRIPRSESGIIGESVSFRKGYIDGLKSFIVEHKVGSTSLGIWATPEVLTGDDALQGYLRGLRRESPNAAREYPTKRSIKEFIYLNRDPEPEWLQRQKTQLMFIREGYRLGFVVGVARDFDMTLDILEDPTDDPAYNAFMAGLKAEPRALPVERRSYRNKKYSKFYEEENSFTAQLRAHEMIDNTVYQAGLRIWLHTQGVTGVSTWAIRHPEALRAFKAGLSGEVLPEYSIQPRIDPLSPKKYPYGERKKIINKLKLFDDMPNPLEEARTQGRMAYQLGLTARITIEAKSR